jgi:pyruvate dehydrogenase E1 component alpha subunit
MALEFSVFDRAPDDTLRVLDPDGEVVAPELVPALDDETHRSLYRDLVTTRHLDERLVSLQRQGRLGTYAPSAGQEASAVGTTHALRADDPVSYQYREHGAVVARGFPPEYLHYWAGHESGNAALWDVNVFPLNISIAGHVPHATGLAWAAKLQGDDRVVACHLGDGATSEGDFHEGLNFAGVFDVPAVFFCNNNGWAISVPRERQTASETLAGKAVAYGFEGVQVDGMDPLAVYQVTHEALEKARAEEPGRLRPTLIEAVQYRFGAHTTADDPSVYRDEKEVERWRQKDPIPRLETYLRDQGILDDDRVADLEASVETEVAEAIETAEVSERPAPEDMFEHVYADRPRRLEEQRRYLQRLRERHGDEALLE